MINHGIVLEPGYTITRIVEGSGFHTANGVAFGPDGRLFAASVLGESIFALDLASGAIEVAVGPLPGESDDLLFTPDGDMIWTALLEGVVRIRSADGRTRDLASGLPGANSIALTRDARRLFVGQVFMGEGLWEVDLAGAVPPRLVMEDTGGLNACQFGPDGMIYAPSWERGHVVRVDPDSGESTVIAEGFKKPGAVRFDAQDQLYVLDDATGELFALDREGDDWRRRPIARLASATDNMAMGPDGLIYVSNMADNSIHQVNPRSGATRVVVEGKLGFPRAIALFSAPDGDVLHVADSCAYRVIDARSGEVRDVARAVETSLKFPTSISVNARHVVLTSELFGVLQILNRDGGFVRDVKGFDKPGAAIECEDGSFVVTEPVAGHIVRVRDDERSVLADGLRFPAGLADGHDGTVYVAESATGRLLRIDLGDGAVKRVADDLGAVRSVAVGPDRSIAVLDVGEGRLFTVDPASGTKTLVVRGLPVGYLQEPYPRSGSVAVGSDGAIYVAADIENALYRIHKE